MCSQDKVRIKTDRVQIRPSWVQGCSSNQNLHVVGDGGDEGGFAGPWGAVQEQPQLVGSARPPVEVCIPLELVQAPHNLRKV